jgi:ribonuclease-3
LNEHPDFKLYHNERLEFLGVQYWRSSSPNHLFNNFPDTPEGDLTNWRASLVNAKMLAQISGDIGLDNYLFYPKENQRIRTQKRGNISWPMQ